MRNHPRPTVGPWFTLLPLLAILTALPLAAGGSMLEALGAPWPAVWSAKVLANLFLSVGGAWMALQILVLAAKRHTRYYEPAARARPRGSQARIPGPRGRRASGMRLGGPVEGALGGAVEAVNGEASSSGSTPFFPAPMRHPPALPSPAAPAATAGTPSERSPGSRPQPRTALLLNPFYPKDPQGSFGKHVLTPSLALSSLAAVTPPSWSVRIWDENLLQGPAPIDPVPTVVGITVHLTFAPRAYALAAAYRALGSIVVLGGPHMHARPEEGAPHADAICVGNGVAAWPRILTDLEAGSLRPRYEADYANDFGAEPVPARALQDRESYLTTLSLIATRGCVNRCDFCYLSTKGPATPYRTRPVADVAREMAASREPYGVFLDNNLGGDPEYLRHLCAVLAPVGKIWSAAVTLEVATDLSLVRAMALAGCIGVFVGLESLDGDGLRAQNKHAPDLSEVETRVARFQAHGIQVNGSFVFGFDHDGPEVFDRTVEWIERMRLSCATFHILTPYPGTPLFDRMAAAGRLLHRDWSRYDTATCVFRPARMTPEQLESGYGRAYERLFSWRSIWARRPKAVTGWPSYFLMTALYKKTNRLWPWAIRHRWTGWFWRPILRVARWRHERYRRWLTQTPAPRGKKGEAAPGRGPGAPRPARL